MRRISPRQLRVQARAPRGRSQVGRPLRGAARPAHRTRTGAGRCRPRPATPTPACRPSDPTLPKPPPRASCPTQGQHSQQSAGGPPLPQTWPTRGDEPRNQGGGRGGASFASNRCLRAPCPTLSACTWRSVRRLRMVASLCGRSAFTATPRVLRDSPVSRYRSPVLVGVPRVDVRTVMLRQVAASCVGALRTWGPPVLRRLSPPEGDNAGRCSSEDDHTRAV